MPKKPRKRKVAVPKRPIADRPVARQPVESDRVTYRELRNTPGRVWERLAAGNALTLVADGEAKALVIPIPDGDARKALDVYSQGRVLLAMRNIQEQARRNGTNKMTLAEINQIIHEVRHELRG